MPPRTKRMLSAGKRMRAKEPKKEYPTIGEFGQIMSGKSVFKLPKEAVEALNKPMINAPTDGRVESYPEYLRRLAADYRADNHGPVSGDYEECAQLIEDLVSALKEHIFNFGGYPTVEEEAILKRVTR